MSARSDKLRTRMELIRSEHPDGDYPAPTHDHEECDECDALRALMEEDDAEEQR